MKKYILYLLGLILVVFGLLTLYLSGSIIFDLFGVRAKQGDYVLLVIWMNFITSFLYLFTAYGFFTFKKWASKTLTMALFVLILGAIGFYFHINSGGIYIWIKLSKH